MNFGINYLTEFPSRIIDWVTLAEASGFDHIWFVDSHILWMDPYPYLTMSALNTKKTKLGTCVTNPIMRHPTVTASVISTINEISGGRAVLGIGRGDSAVRAMDQNPSTLAQFKDGVTQIKKLCSGEEVTYGGKPFKLRWLTQKPPSIYIAAYGPKVLSLAGQVADGIILQIADPDVIEWSIKHARKGATEAGKDPDALEVIVATACYVSDNIEKARDEVRWYPAVVSNHVLDLLNRYKAEELPPQLVKDMEIFRGKYDYEEHCRTEAEHAKYVTDEMIDRFSLIGNVDACVEKINTLEKLGATQICLYLFGSDKEYLTKTFGESIIPQFG